MSVIRINKTRDFTVMSNYHFRDKRLSLKAKGLLSQMLSLPENWDYTISGLVAINKENETAINATLKELKEFGYLIVTKRFPDETKSGRIEYIYDIYEQPHGKQGIEKQGVENQGVEFQGVENQGQYNTNNKNTDNKDTNNKRFRAPTLDEVLNYCNERKNGVNAQRFIDYYTANGWKVGRNPMKDWKAAVRTWERGSEAKAQERDDSLDDIF